jgi:WD40 repeat protein
VFGLQQVGARGPTAAAAKRTTRPSSLKTPTQIQQCCCLSWNLQRRDQFLSSSWDDTIKLWSAGRPASLATFVGHTYCVYHVAWCVVCVVW